MGKNSDWVAHAQRSTDGREFGIRHHSGLFPGYTIYATVKLPTDGSDRRTLVPISKKLSSKAYAKRKMASLIDSLPTSDDEIIRYHVEMP